MLAAESRPYPTLAVDAASAEETEGVSTAAQAAVMRNEESDWIKSIKKRAEGEENVEKVWIDPMVLDERIAGRMRLAELGAENEEKVRILASGIPKARKALKRIDNLPLNLGPVFEITLSQYSIILLNCGDLPSF